MNPLASSLRGPPPWTAAVLSRRQLDALASDLLPLLDVVCVLLAGAASTWLCSGGAWPARADMPVPGHQLTQAMLWSTVLAPFMLYDERFGARARRGWKSVLARSHAWRFGVFVAMLIALGAVSQTLTETPPRWMALWLATAFAATSLTRWLAARHVLRQSHLFKQGRTRSFTRSFDWIAMALPVDGALRRGADVVGGIVPITLLSDRPIKRWSAFAKGAEDLLLGSLLTLLLLPLLGLIALAIRLESPGPVIFRQRRHMMDNREFDIFKFRSMRCSVLPPGAGLQQTAREDPRITRVGRILRSCSLDELPQLFNVLLGTMSLVGPRPHATDMRTENRLGSEITERYAHRHRVKPGITGWAQVHGARGATDTVGQLQRRVELDLHYVEHWSLLLDLKILLLTFGAVLKRTNAY